MSLNCASIVCLGLIAVFLLSSIQGGANAANIVERPSDVTGSSCGSEIRMTCVATSKFVRKVNTRANVPEIKWWHRNHTSSVTLSEQVMRDERVEIEIEEYYTVRSTLIIRHATVSDEGIYQCRASNHPLRHKPGLQYWKIEEAPVSDIQCPPPEESVVATSAAAPPITSSAPPPDKVADTPPSSTATPTKVAEATQPMKRNLTESDGGIKVEVVAPSYPQALTTQSFPNDKRAKGTKRNRKARRSSATTTSGRGAGSTVHHSSSTNVLAHMVCVLLTVLTLK